LRGLKDGQPSDRRFRQCLRAFFAFFNLRLTLEVLENGRISPMLFSSSVFPPMLPALSRPMPDLPAPK
jgi:hypothetical protein